MLDGSCDKLTLWENLAAPEKCHEISGIQTCFFPAILAPIKDNWDDCLTFPWIDLCIRRYRRSDTVSPMAKLHKISTFHNSLTNLLQNGCWVRDVWSEDGICWPVSLKKAGKTPKKAQHPWCHSRSMWSNLLGQWKIPKIIPSSDAVTYTEIYVFSSFLSR